MYQIPRQLSDLDTQAAAGQLIFRASTPSDAGIWQYRLYLIAPDSPDAGFDEQGRPLLVAVSGDGSVREVAGPRTLKHEQWAEEVFDGLWEAQSGGPSNASSVETWLRDLEQSLVDHITSGTPPARQPLGPGPEVPDGEPEWQEPPQAASDLVPGERVAHVYAEVAARPHPDEVDDDDLVEAVVVSTTEGSVLVQDLDADDEPYEIDPRQIVHWRPIAQPAEPPRFRPRSQENLAPSGPLARIRANIAAIRTLAVLREENRPASAAEQVVLARWSSWGAVPQIFDLRRPELAGLRAELRGLLSEEEWYAAEATTRNAHFTDLSLVEPVWQALADLGFTGDRVLEPGSGAGNFIALAPPGAEMTGVELDPVTAAIAAALYPDAEIRAESFADTRMPDGYYDLAVGNVPFDEVTITDPVHNPLRLSTHNAFIVKSLDLVRPGGLVAVLTSRWTMDSTGTTARMEIADRADLVGAVRLPAGAHRKAAGTDAVTDLLILRRRDGNPPQTPPDWVSLASVQIDKDTSVLINRHFAQHPEMVLGELGTTSTPYGRDDVTVRPRAGVDLPAALGAALAAVSRQARESGLVMSASPDAVQRAAIERRAERMRQAQEAFGADLARFEGTLVDQGDGTFLQVIGGEFDDRPVYQNAVEELQALLGLRDVYIELLSAESAGEEGPSTLLRGRLNDRYDAYVRQFGFLNDRETRRDRRSAHGAFRTDPYAAGVYALEIYDKDSRTARKSDIFVKSAEQPKAEQTTADTPQDALAITLNALGKVELSEIARLLGDLSLDEARERLGDLVFNERGGRLVPAAEYLSGNVRAKLEHVDKILAMVSDEMRSRHPLQANRVALRRVLPKDKQPGDIGDVEIGATWIKPEYYTDFIRQLLQSRYVTVTRQSGADWEVEASSGVRKSRAATQVYGTKRRDAVDLFERMLRRGSLVVRPPKPEEDASEQTIQDGKRWAAEQTEQAVAKADELNRLFADWIWQDPGRTKDLLVTYNKLHNSYVPYAGDGAHLTFPGLSDTIVPLPHQRAAVARALVEPYGSFFDHEVGAGKTYSIAMTLMEMKRLGMVRKPAIVVKNSTIGDFRNDFLKAYRKARVLAIDSAEFTRETAAAYVAQIANGDWDAVILPQSLFKRIPVSGRGQQAFVAAETAEYRARIHKVLTGDDEALSPENNPGGDPLIGQALEAAAAASADVAQRDGRAVSKETVKKLQGDLKRHTTRAEKNLVKQSAVGISWEQTGIDFLAIDEVQDFANGEIGANNSELALTVSAQAKDLKVKLRTMFRAYGRKVGLGATGTPFPNAMPQAFVMLNYFRPDLLEAAEVSAFSSFQAQYLQQVVAPEISPEGVPRIKERIGAFRNAAMFSHSLWRVMADVRTKQDLNLPVPDHVSETVVVSATEADRLYMAYIADRAEEIRGGAVDASVDNLLKISNDGRMAAMDLRMVGETPDGPGKLDAAADRIAQIWEANRHRAYTDREGNPSPLRGALQLVFADRGTASDEARKDGRFIAYDHLREELVKRGIPEGQIRYAQDAKNSEEKEQLFADARLGKVAVLIGSTDTMGVGVNVQDRAIALHHLDCPWRPSDVTQREGRLVRQYNQHFKMKVPVQIYRWVKEGSFDSFMWQTVERKARFIDQVRTGRELEEQDAALDGDLGKDYLEFGEIKAIATGNPLMLKKLQSDEEVRQLEAAYKSWRRTNTHLRQVVDTGDETLAYAQGRADLVQRALQTRTDTKGEAFRMELASGQVVTKRSEAATALRTGLELLRRQMRGDVSAWEHVATVAGQRFEARINAFHDFIEFSIRGLRDIPGANFTVDDLGALLGDSKSPLGLVTRMENQAERLTELHGRLVGVVEELRQEIDRAQKLVDQPFTKQEKLRRARAEQARLVAEIETMSTGREQYEDPDRPTAPGGNGEGMSLADMALHDAEVMARELGGVGVVIQDGQWYGTAAGESNPPSGADPVRAEEADLALPDDVRTALVLPDEELPDIADHEATPFAGPEEAIATAERAQAAFRAWARTNTSRSRLADANTGLRRPPDTPPNQVTALHEAYFHAMRYRDDDPVEWRRRYANVIAQARQLAHDLRTREMSAAEALDVEETFDIEVLDRVSETLTQVVARTLATRAFGPATGRTPPAPRRSASPDGREAAPYAHRAEYWAAEQVLVSDYRAWNSQFVRNLDGTDAERALAHAAESFLTESSRTRAARLLRLDHVLDPALATTFARRLRAVADQWDREQCSSQTVASTWALYKAAREHAARYEDTVDDPQVYQQWLDDVEPITFEYDDQEEAQFVPGLHMDSWYTITGPSGERTEPVLGVYLDEAIGQLLADGMALQDVPTGLVLSGPQGRFDVTLSTAASDSAPDGEGKTPSVAEETIPAEPEPSETTDLEPAGSSLPQARQMAVLLGHYGSPADLIAGRKQIGESIAAVRQAIDTAAADEASAEFIAAADAVARTEQVGPAEVFAAYDRLAVAAVGLAEAAGPSGTSLPERADRLAQRVHRHLGRMHATGRDMVDVLLDAAGMDPEAMSVLTRTNPLKERPTPYSDSGHLHVGRSLVFDTYDRWPDIYNSTGGEATDQLRGAMWNARQTPDTALSTALPDWMLIVSHALGAIDETDNLTSRSVLRDVAQRAYQHHQALAAHQVAAADSPPYGPDRAYADGMGTLVGAWEAWLATATGRDMVERSDRTTDSAPAEARAALEEVRQALYAAEWATTDDGTVDDVTRRTTKLAHTTYALVLTLREGAFRAPGDDKAFNRLVRTAYEHAASTRAAAASPEGVEAIRTGLARLQEQLRAEGSRPPTVGHTIVPGPQTAPEELEIEHHYRGTVVRGTTNEPGDAAVRAALDRHEFRFSHKQQMWYLPRRMVHANRDAHVRALLDEFNRLGRTYRLVEQPQDQEAAGEAVIPAGEPYTNAEEAKTDFAEMFGAYWRMKDTPAGKRLISRGTGARPDGEAVHRALEDLRQGPVGSSRDPFEHPAADVVRRSVELARTVQTLARNLEEERYRAPVVMRHFRAMTSFATQLASRITATAASEGLWDRLFSEGTEAPAPGGPSSTALEPPAPQRQPEEEPAARAESEAAQTALADALVSGSYTDAGLLEAVEALHVTVLQAAELLPANPRPEGPPGAPSGGPEEWFRGRARIDVPDGYVPYASDTVRLRPGDVVREGFKRWPESRRPSYRTLVVTAQEPDRDGYYDASPSTRLHPREIVAVPADSRLLTGADDDRYTLRHTFDERWQTALQAGRAAAGASQLLSAAVEAYRAASAVTTALTHVLDASLAPSARDALSRLTEAMERHLVRLTVSHRIEQEAATQARPAAHAPDRDIEPGAAPAADESSPDHKRADLQAELASTQERRIEHARDLAVRAALADDTVRAWFTGAEPEQVLRERFREWLRVTRLNRADDLVADRFADYFTGTAEEAAEQAAGEVFATVHAAFQEQQATTTDTTAVDASPREEDQAPPARAARLAETARANGWTVAGSWARWSNISSRHYELTLRAQTTHGAPRYLLTWELKAGRYTYNAQRSAAYSRAGRIVNRPALADVELTVQEPALAPGGAIEQALRDGIDPSVPAAQDTLFDNLTEQKPQQPATESRPERGGETTVTGTPLTQRHLDTLPHRVEQQPDRVARLAVVATLRLPGVEIRDALLLLSNIEVDDLGSDPIVYGAQITPHSSPVSTSLDAQFQPGDLLAMPDARVLPLSAPLPWSTIERLATLEPHQARLALPLGEPFVPPRLRFTTTGQLRTHFKAAPMPHLSAEARRDLAERADLPGFALAPNGQFALVREGERWDLLAAGSGIEIGRVDEYAYLLGSGIETALAVMGGLPSHEDAVAFSEQLAALRDQDGNLIPWDEPRLAVNRAIDGYELDRLVLRERAAFDHEAGRDASTSQALLVWSLITPRKERDTAPDGQIYADQLEAGDRVWFDAGNEYRIREVIETSTDEPTGLITVTLATLLAAEDGTLEQESTDEWHVPRNMLLNVASPQDIQAETGLVQVLAPTADRQVPQAEPPASEQLGAEAVQTIATVQEAVPPAPATAGQDSASPASVADRADQEENVAAADPQAEGPWSSRIQIITDSEGTFVTGTGGAYFQQERELRELLKKKGQNFAFRDGRWRYMGRAANRARALEEIRAYLRAKDAEEATAATVAEPAVEYPPTAQQQAIIDAVMAGQDVAVQALAGTGKTSTMLMLARRMPDKRIAYIAFNRSIADEAKRKFPRSVTADTSHGFARRVMINTLLKTKISKAGRNGGAWHRPADLAQALGITAPLRYRGGKIDPEDVARIVKEAIVKYRESADQEIEAHHLGAKWARTPAARALLDVVRRAWADIADPNSNNVLFSHDDYLKLWALTSPRLNYDLIIFDEAQDINPVLKKVIENQTVQTVVVGDSHQAIYEFRGAIDALRDWPADVVLPLTQSWRFGSDVAALGNAYLQLLGSGLVLEGNPALSTSVGPVETPDAVLSRTNVGAIGAVFAGFEAGRRVALVGGGRDIEDVAKAAQDLQRGRRTKHPELATFASWSEVRDHAEEEGDKSLQMFVRLVDKYSAEGLIGMIRDLVPEDAKSEETRPDVIVSTAHKAKGREWDNVRIADDFPQPKEDETTGELVLDPGELRLAYVTVTRAKGRLELGSLDWIRTFNALDALGPGPAAVLAQEEAIEAQPEPVAGDGTLPPAAEPLPEASAEPDSARKEAHVPQMAEPAFEDVTMSEGAPSLPAAVAPDAPLPNTQAAPELASAGEDPSKPMLTFDDGEEREAPPEEVADLLTGASAADGTSYLDIFNESQSPSEGAADADADEPTGADESSSFQPDGEGPQVVTPVPLPWDDKKIGKRAEAGTKRAQSVPIPQLARQVGDALGLTMARVVWELDHPTDQFRTNLEHTLAGFSDSEQPVRQLVAEVAVELERGIARIAERAGADYAALIEPARGEPSRLASVDEQLMQAARSPEFDNPYVREAMILVMRSIDQAERTARQRGLKPAVVRNALDQVVGLAGSVARGGQRVPLMHDVLTPVLVRVDAAREFLTRAGLPSTVAEEYARLRSLIAEYEQRQAPAGARSVAIEDTEQPPQADAVPPLADADIAAAILRFDERAFGQLIFDMEADRPRRPEVHGVDVPLTTAEASSGSAAEKGLLYANASGMEMTVSAGGVAVRGGKLGWAKTIAWLRPALTSRRRELASLLWMTGNRLRRTETGFAAIGERDHYAAAQVELDGLARTVQERIVDDALGAHRSGVAAVLAAHNSKGAVAADGALISLEEIIDGTEDANSEDETRMLERARQIRAVLPDQHSTVRELRDVRPGDLFPNVSARRLPFLAKSSMSRRDGRLSVDGVLISPDGETTPYTWSESWWTPEARLQPILLPDSLARLVALPAGQDHPATEPAHAEPAPVPREPAAVEPSTEAQALAAPADSPPTAESAAPAPEQPPAAQVPMPAPQSAAPVPASGLQPQTQAVGYRTLEELLRDLVETDRLHAMWASSPTGRLLLAEAQELREETGFADATEAARVDSAVVELLATVDSTRARSSLLLANYRNLLTVVADAGRSMGGRQAFQSGNDRELLLDLYVVARDQLRRLEATKNLPTLLASTAGGAWLLTRYRRRQEERASASQAVQPDTSTQDRVAGGVGEPATGAPGEETAASKPEVLASADHAVATATPMVQDEPAPLASPSEVFGSFDFWRDVIGDDLVVGGVVYDSAVYEPDGKGGVRRRGEEQNEPWPSQPMKQENQARIEEAAMATPVVDSGDTDHETDDDLDRAFEDAIALLRDPEPPTAEAAPPTALNHAGEQRIRDQYVAVRQALSPVLTSSDAEPVTAEPADPGVESSDAADLDAAMDNARAEVGYYWGTPEWSAIRTISQAARDFRAAVREAAFDYAQNTLSDVRTNGLDRTIQARAARAVSNISLALARRLERSGQRDTRGWRAVWGLHRSAVTRADRLTGNLPADQRIDLAGQLRRAWQWLTQRITGTELDAPQTASEGLAAPIAGSMSAIRRLYEAIAERLGGLAEHPVWRRIASVWAAGRTLVDRVRMGAGRMMADRQSLGTLRMLWVRTLEIISAGARFLMNRLDAGGERDGLRWNLLRVLRHAAEDHIAQAHGHLAPGASTPLGSYEQAGPDPSPETQAPVTGAEAGSDEPRDQASEDRFRDVVLEVAKSAFTLPMDLMYHLDTHRVPYAEAVSMLERMEQLGIVDAVRDGVREVLVTPERAGEILDRLPKEMPPSQPETQPQQRPSASLAPTDTKQPTEQPKEETKATELPQRRRAKASGEPSRIAAAAGTRSAADPAQRSNSSVTRDQFLAQASRLRQRAEFARATATTPPEERRADILNKIADRAEQSANKLGHGPGTGRAPTSGRVAVTAEAFIAALQVHAQARGEQVPNGLLEGAMQMAVDAGRQPPRATVPAAALPRSRREAAQRTAERHGQERSSAPSSVRRR